MGSRFLETLGKSGLEELAWTCKLLNSIKAVNNYSDETQRYRVLNTELVNLRIV
jgi:hypothetical protein